MRLPIRYALLLVLLGGSAVGAWTSFRSRVLGDVHDQLRALGAAALERSEDGAEVLEGAPLDPWGHPYRYARGRFTCWGADGEVNGSGRDADHVWEVQRCACSCGAR